MATQNEKGKLAELHLHLGGANSPQTLWNKSEALFASDPILSTLYHFEGETDFLNFFSRERKNLNEYLEMHKLVGAVQNVTNLDYYIRSFLRDAYNNGLSYIELRHCPYGRTSPSSSKKERINQMRNIVSLIDLHIKANIGERDDEKYPVSVRQIICLHSGYDHEVNTALTDLAIELFELGIVCALDIAGGETAYHPKSIIKYFQRAKANGLYTTAHIFETKDCPPEMLEILPYIDRIGHGTYLPLNYKSELGYLAEKEICLEVCPTTYFKCGTFDNYTDPRLRKLFETCEDLKVPVAIGTDNGGLHQVSLGQEYERLTNHHIISPNQAERYRQNAFKYAFTGQSFDGLS